MFQQKPSSFSNKKLVEKAVETQFSDGLFGLGIQVMKIQVSTNQDKNKRTSQKPPKIQQVSVTMISPVGSQKSQISSQSQRCQSLQKVGNTQLIKAPKINQQLQLKETKLLEDLSVQSKKFKDLRLDNQKVLPKQNTLKIDRGDLNNSEVMEDIQVEDSPRKEVETQNIDHKYIQVEQKNEQVIQIFEGVKFYQPVQFTQTPTQKEKPKPTKHIQLGRTMNDVQQQSVKSSLQSEKSSSQPPEQPHPNQSPQQPQSQTNQQYQTSSVNKLIQKQNKPTEPQQSQKQFNHQNTQPIPDKEPLVGVALVSQSFYLQGKVEGYDLEESQQGAEGYNLNDYVISNSVSGWKDINERDLKEELVVQNEMQFNYYDYHPVDGSEGVYSQSINYQNLKSYHEQQQLDWEQIEVEKKKEKERLKQLRVIQQQKARQDKDKVKPFKT